MKDKVILEPAAEEVSKESSIPPLIFELPPAIGREKLEKAQNFPVYKYPVNISSTIFNTEKNGNIKVYFVSPVNSQNTPRVIFYIHGAGWVFGSFHTHEKLVRELSARTNSIIIFPEYTRSPEVRFPVAIEQCYSTMCNIPKLLRKMNLVANLNNFTVAGDSVGGNMAIAMAFMSKYQNGPKIHKELLYYPVTNDDFNTDSYNQFAEGYYLYKDGMKWFWDQYAPNLVDRNYIIASPLKASLEQLKGFPSIMIINGEADVLRDEGEEFASKLMKADVDVTQIRFKGMIHDFVMLNSLDNTNACRSAMDVSTCWINRKNNDQ